MEKKNDKTNTKTAWNLIKFGGALCLLSTTIMACGKAPTSTNAIIAPKTVSLCEHMQEMLVQTDEVAVMNHIISDHLSKEGAYNIEYSFVKGDKRIYIVEPKKVTNIVDGLEKEVLLAPEGYTLQTDEAGQTYAMKITNNETITDIVEPIKTTKIIDGVEKSEFLAPAGYTLEVDEKGKTIAKKVTNIEPDNQIYLSYKTSEKYTELSYNPTTQQWTDDFTINFATEEEIKKIFSK